MAANSAIEWCEATWNCLAGCDAVSPGCAHCYAATMTRRLESMGQADYAGLTTAKHFNGVVRPLPHKLDIPLKRRKPTMYFVNSMSDLFHDDVPDEFIAAVFGVIAASPKHTFQVLTKRAQRMHDWMRKMTEAGGLGVYIRSNAGRDDLRDVFSAVTKTEMVNGELQRHADDPWMQVMNGAACNYGKAPLFNVWLGVSCEDQKRADERIPWLLKTPAAVRFLSCEPLLGPIDLGPYLSDMDGIGWVIVGGESGHDARPCNIAWIRSIVEQCKAAGVSVFVKQIGSSPVFSDPMKTAHASRRSKGGDLAAWPEDLRIREFPTREPAHA